MSTRLVISTSQPAHLGDNIDGARRKLRQGSGHGSAHWSIFFVRNASSTSRAPSGPTLYTISSELLMSTLRPSCANAQRAVGGDALHTISAQNREGWTPVASLLQARPVPRTTSCWANTSIVLEQGSMQPKLSCSFSQTPTLILDMHAIN